MWSGLPRSLTLQLISIHVQKVHEHLICREGVIKGRCNLCFPQAWGGQLCPIPTGVQPPKSLLSPLSSGVAGCAHSIHLCWVHRGQALLLGASRVMGTSCLSFLGCLAKRAGGLWDALFRGASDALNPDTAR